MSFSNQVGAFAKKAKSRVDRIRRKIAFTVFTRVILRTPVDTGRLRNNWYASIGTPSDSVDDSTPDPMSSVISEIGKLHGDESIFLTNNLPYAEVIENGSSKQAPQGMVRVTLREFQSIVKGAIR